MAYGSESKANKDLTWYSKLGAAVKGKASSKDLNWDYATPVDPECIGNVPNEPRQWRGFVLAEAMEQGLGPGPSSAYTEPQSVQEQRLVVQRSQNRQTHTLQRDAGDALLIAKVSSDGLRFDLFASRDGESPNLGPLFTLVATSSARDHWCLYSVRCERCESKGRRQCGRRELARLTHYVETVGDGQAFCMDVELPAVAEDGDRVVICEQCRDTDTATKWGIELSAKRPKWNPKHKSLTLDFHGRCSMASAKNFQLEDPKNPGKHKFLFGKVSENRFVLDYQSPLGMVQAFAAALSASHWK